MTTRQGSRAQWWGALAILLVAGFYAFALPLISDATSGDELVADQPYAIADGLTIVPAPGWSLSSNTPSFVTLTKAGAVLGFVPPAPRENAREIIEATVESLRNDPDNDWQVGAIRQFTTDRGDPGLELEAYAQTVVQSNWIVADEGWVVTVIGTAPEQVWLGVSDEMETMVRSIALADPEQ